MTENPRLIVALLAAAILFSTPALALKLDVEGSLGESSTSNLFSDSTGQNDAYSSLSLDLGYYPLDLARVKLISEYTAYGANVRLNNLLYGAGITVLPLSDESPFSVYLEANYRDREYIDNRRDTAAISANEFSGREYDLLLALGYDLTDLFQLRLGYSRKSFGYGIEGVNDRETDEFYLGSNFSLFERLGIDFELGYSAGKYQHIDTIVVAPNGDPLPRRSITPGDQYDILLEDDLNSSYFSARLSSPLGRKTGLVLTWSRRQFVDRDEAAIIYGYSTGYLSPWVNRYAGDAVLASLKTYVVPRVIVTVDVGYWSRDHIKVVEREFRANRFGQIIPTINLLYAQTRSDHRRRINITLQMPLTHEREPFIEPSLHLGYTDNNSTVRVYEYVDFSVSGGIKIRF
jgi:hypothetical protein